ncbi:DMT family transporter [Pyrobaculum neutrophilum]|uniref:EamA domain-containing protein n=1 Tax=Pyrobaculum neutrophilum (strain DSM 2338 / JCM 9278 / NBRC 100436 / V24Sta) TaxID=444157 RepID=B1YCG7_PYRNV|nr:DMT family transporter [Pyrobaculum neutrophilum]ACB39480.1 protein of unknown function DUF6 transmembrane [Pyrobaculum neutrophilum V24Sta]
MDLSGAAAALTAALIWALVIFLYKREMETAGAAAVNFSRLLYVAVLMWPVLLLGAPTPGLWAAAASGLITLVVGDSLYFYAIQRIGGSTAAPLAYTYVVIAQYLATLLGEVVSHWLAASAVLTVVGAALLAKGGSARLEPLGVAAALAAALMWSLGMAAVKLAAMGQAHPLVIAYIRAAAACAALGIYLAARRRVALVKSPLFAAASLLDLGLGSALFAYAVGAAGLAVATILVSTSPLITQLYARATGAERIGLRQTAGALSIFLAIYLALRG